MKKLTVFAVALMLLAAGASKAEAQETIYFENGDFFTLEPGEKIYVTKGQLWEFTRFLTSDLRIQARTPIYISPETIECDGLTFGGDSCDTEEETTVSTVESEEETEEECDGFTFGGGCAGASRQYGR